ncbi:MAG TPA: serine/threonine-protein kinase [Gemmataceae bacterium]|nr:serine/threonine-protein kinase [Gemmataceae bacterium]
MKFTYSSGQRVLDGYTLKRGIGRGGFGEVYYAVSDAGKEVALKLVQGNNLDIELRGIAQCLNLKHPNLLTLYDLRTDGHGDHWVIMEYIAGEPLSVVLSRHPKGLPAELAGQWFLSLARAVGYLHDHGIVHRDLKPGNIFVENGQVKVGDYGLCKLISSSQRNAQTGSVGTVYYMAPEISTGNYNKQIDVYSAGIILYEMLTGQVPFDGESAGEILMKHLTSPPDLHKLPGAFQTIVGKALAKNPAHRYLSMGEMAKAVEAALVPPVRPAPANARPRPAEPVLHAIPVNEPIPTAQLANPPLRGQLAELSGSLALAAVLAGLFSMLWARLASLHDWTDIGSGFFLTVLASWAVLVPAKVFDTRRGDAGLRRGCMLIIGLLVGLAALWIDGWSLNIGAAPGVWTLDNRTVSTPLFHEGGINTAAGYLSYFGLAFFALRWWRMADRRRSQRFSLAPILASGFWAVVLYLIFWPRGGAAVPETIHGAVALVLTSAIVQLVSPWEPPLRMASRPAKLRYA